MVRVLGKGGKQRLVPFNASTAKAIRALLEGLRGAAASAGQARIAGRRQAGARRARSGRCS